MGQGIHINTLPISSQHVGTQEVTTLYYYANFHSLSRVAFEWYYLLENETVNTWIDMEDAFCMKFTSASDKITIPDLANTKRKKDETILNYITRWRNLSIKCEQPLEQQQAVRLLVGNIDKRMAPFLCMNNISIYQELIT